jgi:cation transport ATPase
MNTYLVQINGSTQSRQAHRLESELRLLSGVTDASVATDTGHVIVRGREGLLPLISRALNEAGYELASNQATRRTSFARWYRHGWLSEPTRAA